MDHHKKRVIGKSAEQIGRTYYDPPGTVPYQPRQNDLEQDETQYGKEGVFVLPDEFSHFRMLLQDLPGTKPVRLLFFGVNKISSL